MTLPSAPRLPLRRNLLALPLLLAALLLGPVPALADAKEAEAFMRGYSEKAISMLSDPSLGDEARVEAFRGLLQEGFQIPLISKFVLGRYGRKASKEEFAEFMEVFELVLARRYAPLFKGASSEVIRIGAAQPVKNKTDLFLVASTVTTEEGTPASVSWRVKDTGKSYRILDVVVEGVSMAITLRDEYGSVMRNGGVPNLIKQLRAISTKI